MSSTDYVLRVLFDRLARSFNALATRVSTLSGGSFTMPNYDTVADMLAAPPTEITAFATCTNYVAADENESMWFKSASATAANGTDIRESTHTAGVFYERLWVREAV